jgi:hypothetical protein
MQFNIEMKFMQEINNNNGFDAHFRRHDATGTGSSRFSCSIPLQERCPAKPSARNASCALTLIRQATPDPMFASISPSTSLILQGCKSNLRAYNIYIGQCVLTESAPTLSRRPGSSCSSPSFSNYSSSNGSHGNN